MVDFNVVVLSGVVVGFTVVVGSNVEVGSCVVVGSGVVVGSYVVVGSNVSVDPGENSQEQAWLRILCGRKDDKCRYNQSKERKKDRKTERQKKT